MSEPAPELEVEDALRGVASQLIINGERMPVIIPGSVIEALGVGRNGRDPRRSRGNGRARRF